MIRGSLCRRSAALRVCIPPGTQGRGRRTRIAYANCLARCAAKKTGSAARGSCALSHWPSGASHAAFFRHWPRENCSMRRAGRAALATTRYSSSPFSGKHTRKFRAKQRISIVTAETPFARRSISSHLALSLDFSPRSEKVNLRSHTLLRSVGFGGVPARPGRFLHFHCGVKPPARRRRHETARDAFHMPPLWYIHAPSRDEKTKSQEQKKHPQGRETKISLS